MCLFMSVHGPRAVTRAAEIFQVSVPEVDLSVVWVASGFDHPRWPVLLAGAPPSFGFPMWGLVPPWVKSAKEAAEMKNRTLNARAESIGEKPAFRQAALSGRCLILLDGFFEYHKRGRVSYPFYIHRGDGGLILVAGLTAGWNNPETGEKLFTFSLVTTAANAMMAEIHNDNKRMPAILSPAAARQWLDPTLAPRDLAGLLEPRDIPGLVAHPVSRLLGARAADRNVPAVQETHVYPELSSLATSDGRSPIPGS